MNLRVERYVVRNVVYEVYYITRLSVGPTLLSLEIDVVWFLLDVNTRLSYPEYPPFLWAFLNGREQGERDKNES